MKVKHLIAALELGRPNAEVYVQRSLENGYFELRKIEATQPDGHVGAMGFVIHTTGIHDLTEEGPEAAED